MTTTLRLEGHEIFRRLRPDQMEAISSAAEEILLAAGTTVFEAGQPADDFYVVLEGQVALRLPRRGEVSVLIDEATEGAVFGSCVCVHIDSYMLSARCTEDSRLLKIKASTLKKLMDEDLVLGYTLQTTISRVYFRRYIDTMRKLQAVVQSIPLEAS